MAQDTLLIMDMHLCLQTRQQLKSGGKKGGGKPAAKGKKKK
jgi:hypothetical protein